jgi:hypothetical protein
MAAMKLAGSEVDHQFSDTFQTMIHDESLDQRMKNRMMEQMQMTFDDLEGESNFGFDDLSLERFRQDLLEEFNKDKSKYLRMPKGVYTGFKADGKTCTENGLIALLGFPAKPSKTVNHEYRIFDLIYIDKNGKSVLLNQKDVLEVLTKHKDENRFVSESIDKGNEAAINELVKALQRWLKDQSVEEQIQEDGSKKRVMGSEAKDLLTKLKRGDRNSISRIKENILVDEKFQMSNFDLITWFLVTK